MKKKQSGKKKHTLKQLKWLKSFIKTGNKAEATRKAGYKMGSKGGSKTKRKRQMSESHIGSQNYHKLSHIVDKILEKEKIDKNWVKKRLIAEAVSGKTSKDRTYAVIWLGKHFKMFTDKVEHSGEVKEIVKIYLPDNKRKVNNPVKG